jgi:acyl carrier protein
MSDNAKQAVLGFISSTLPELAPEDVVLQKSLTELGLDSMDLNSLALELEEEFGISIDDEALEKLQTAGDFISFTERALKNVST